MVGARPSGPTELRAVVRLGECSAVLVARDIVLTSAHCVDGAPGLIKIAGTDYTIDSCERDSRSNSANTEYDLGICRLHERVTAIRPFELDDGAGLRTGDTVTVAGYGQTGPFAHDSGFLRVIEAAVFASTDERAEIGTATSTACRGDSGGPVLVDRGNGLHVAAIVHGGSGAICASPTEVTQVVPSKVWLREVGVLSTREAPKLGTGIEGLAVVSIVILVFAVLLHRHLRKPASRTPERRT